MNNDLPTTQRPAPRGLIEPRLVRGVTFAILTLCLLTCTVLILLAIWDVAQQQAIWKAIATFIVVGGASALFSAINERLG